MMNCMASTCRHVCITKWPSNQLGYSVAAPQWSSYHNVDSHLEVASKYPGHAGICWTEFCLKFLTSGFTLNSCPLLWCTVTISYYMLIARTVRQSTQKRCSGRSLLWHFRCFFVYKVRTKTKQRALWLFSVETLSSLDISQWQLR